MKAWRSDPPLTSSARVMVVLRARAWEEINSGSCDYYRTQELANHIHGLSKQIHHVNMAKKSRDKRKKCTENQDKATVS